MEIINNGSKKVFLLDLLIDSKGSMLRYEGIMQEHLEELKREAVMFSNFKNDTQFLIGRTWFNNGIRFCGYEDPVQLDTTLNAHGGARIYDGICEEYHHLTKAIEEIGNKGMKSKAMVIILSNGYDINMTDFNGLDAARMCLTKLIMEGVKVCFIAFGEASLAVVNQLRIPEECVLKTENSAKGLQNAMTTVMKKMTYELS